VTTAGQNHTNTLYIHGIFGREITHIWSYTVYIYAGLSRTIQIHCVYTVFLAGKSPTYGRIQCTYTQGCPEPYKYTVSTRYFWQGNHPHTVVYGVHICRVGQNHTNTLCIHGILAGKSPTYSRIRCTYTQGWPEPYICTVYYRMYGHFPAKNTVYTLYIPTKLWF